MTTFGNNILCIDSTHKTTGYDFPLITVLVIDEFGEGYPVAWCIRTRENSLLLDHFFTEIKKIRVGEIEPKWIMTDDADQYYNSLKSVFYPLQAVRKHTCSFSGGVQLPQGGRVPLSHCAYMSLVQF